MAKGVSLAGNLVSVVGSDDLGGRSALDIIVESGVIPSDIAKGKDPKAMADYAARRPHVQRKLLRHAIGGYEFMPIYQAEHLYNEAKKHWGFCLFLAAATIGFGIGSFWLTPVMAGFGAGISAITGSIAAIGASRFKRQADYALAQTFEQSQQDGLIQNLPDKQHLLGELFNKLKPMCPNFVAMLEDELAFNSLPVAGKNTKGRVEGGTPGAKAMRDATKQQESIDARRGKIGSGEKNYGSSSLDGMTSQQKGITARREALNAAAKTKGGKPSK
jgi:hypothetical protein